jgi:serine/threonine protein kinase
MLPMLQSEIAILRELSHVHVISLRESLISSNHVYFVMEYCEGGDLAQYVGKVTEEEVHPMFLQLLLAVSYLHSIGIVHRDIKPENLMLDGRRNLKIIDFGFAVKDPGGCDDHEMWLSTRCGTRHYAAPEVLAGNDHRIDGKKADVWACGITLHVMVSGSFPFPEDSSAFDDVIVYEELPPFDNFRPEFQEYVAFLLCRDPVGRPSAKLAIEAFGTLSRSAEVTVEESSDAVSAAAAGADNDRFAGYAIYHRDPCALVPAT